MAREERAGSFEGRKEEILGSRKGGVGGGEGVDERGGIVVDGGGGEPSDVGG